MNFESVESKKAIKWRLKNFFWLNHLQCTEFNGNFEDFLLDDYRLAAFCHL